VPENADRMRDAIKQQRQKGSFRLAGDLRGSTQRAWVWQAGVKELPVAFIVGKGKIMHIGQPRDATFEEVLGKVINGRYDPVLQQQAQPVLDAARRARKVKNWRDAEKLYDKVIAMDPAVFAPVAIERFEMMLIDKEDKEGAYGYARDALIGGIFSNDSGALRMLAEKIVTDPKLDRFEDLGVAMAAAQKSLEVGGPDDPESLAMAALVHFHRGESREAIDLQTQAYFLARPEVKAQFKRVLEGYRESTARPAEPAAPP
jgi:tetratricopeptide (TPR) repeat protein